jgi:hypothetical protein
MAFAAATLDSRPPAATRKSSPASRIASRQVIERIISHLDHSLAQRLGAA